jgi:hypothetical protein
MADNQFFKLDQYQWFEDFVDTEVCEILQDINTNPEIFKFEDVKF